MDDNTYIHLTQDTLITKNILHSLLVKKNIFSFGLKLRIDNVLQDITNIVKILLERNEAILKVKEFR